MGRPRKWQPAKLTRRDILAGEIVISKYGPDLTLETRLKQDFKSFCRMNRLSKEEAYAPIIGQMKNAGLVAGSIKNYVDVVTRGDRSAAAYTAKRATECMQADTISGHAVDLSLPQANKYIDMIKKRKPTVAPSLWMLLATGGRRIDIHRLHPECVKKTKNFLVVKFLWTKGIRKISHRRIVQLPLDGLTAPPGGMLKLLKTKKKPFECSVAELNQALKSVGCMATTGSFRRLFSRRIALYCTNNNLDKKDLMLHRSKDMDAAFYSF